MSRNSSKSGHTKRRYSGSSRRRAFKNTTPPYKTIVIVTICALLLGGFLIYRLEMTKITENKNGMSGSSAADGASTFDEFLSRANSKQLIAESEHLWQTRGSELPNQIDVIGKRIKIADRILKVSDSPEDYRYAIVSKLDVMTFWSSLNVRYELGNIDLDKRLNSLALDHVNYEDSEIAMKAKMSLTLTAVNKYLAKPSDESYQLAKKYFWDTAESTPGDVVVAGSLFKTAVLVRVAGHSSEAIEMFKKINEVYGKSNILVVKDVAERAYEEYVFTEFELVPLVKQILKGDQIAVADFFTRAEELLQSQIMTEASFRRLFGMIEAIVGAGEVKKSRELLASLDEHLARSVTDPESIKTTSKLLKSMTKRCEAIGRNFSFEGLLTPTGDRFDANLIKDSIVAIIYWDPNNKKAVASLIKLYQYSNSYERSGLKVVAITPSDAFDADTKNELSKFQEQVPEIHFVKADLDSEQGKAFLDRFPIAFVPYVIMLDKNHVLDLLNPTDTQFVDRLSVRPNAPENLQPLSDR